ncbi:Nucleoporin_C domain-containing protein [Lamellibrachia satsuma]|nr:Nucleoporin_C domain-containing protein [Lamellibrachia satsuma]
MLQTFSCVLATATSTLLLLTPQQAQNTVRCRMLRGPQSMLAGISRRMSSFIFGSVATQSVTAPLHAILSGEQLSPDVQAFYVLSGPNLQKWALDGDTEMLLYQCNVEQFLRENIAETVWHQEATYLENLTVWVMDMKVTRDGVVILGAGLNTDVSDEFHYALGTLHTEGQDSPKSFLSFAVPKFTNAYEKEMEKQLLGYRLLLPNLGSPCAYLHDNRMVLCVSISSSNDDVDKVEFQSPGDRLLGAGHTDRLALFFSMVHGLVSIKEMQMKADTSMPDSVLETSSTSIAMEQSSLVCNASQLEELSMSEDKTVRLKAAFLNSCSGNLSQAQKIVDDLFPLGVDMDVDGLVTTLAQEMIDEFPASDPRWAESVHQGGSVTVSLILMQQLEDKLKAHSYYVQFLKNVQLWDRLSSVHVRDSVICTKLLLCELAEKVVAAKALREIHTLHPGIVDAAIKQLLESRVADNADRAAMTSGLIPQDLFYRQVSAIHGILEHLLLLEDDVLSGNIVPQELIAMVMVTNSIFTGMFSAAMQYRASNEAMYQSHDRQQTQLEYVSWTHSAGPKGGRQWMCRQHGITSERALPEAHDVKDRGALFQQLLELSDIVLECYRSQLESIKHGSGENHRYIEVLRKYEQDRATLIKPFMQYQQYERAASLAEKYCDMGTLVQICEETDNQDRLQRYMMQFQGRGFPEYVFKWYMNKGKRGKLLSSSLASHPLLGRFLQTSENKHLSWLHDINAGDFFQAQSTLQTLAEEHNTFVAKKKTLLSLSKLAAYAVEDPPESVHSNIEAVNRELDLILHQEQLPQDVVEGLGTDIDNMRVLSAKEIIDLYVGEYNVDANEFDFMKALDLLQFIDKDDEDVDYEDVITHIWCRAIQKDDWSDIGMDHPFENCKDTVFFKTLEMAYMDGLDLTQCLPAVDRLLAAEELGSLGDQVHFQFLLKAGYEHLEHIFDK